MKSDFVDGALTLYLEGRIDSGNISQMESEIMDVIKLIDNVDISFDVEKLDYISSAGLRVLLKVKKLIKNNIKIVNVSDEVFDIFNVTGFDKIFEVERQMRRISLEGCKKISSALNGEIYKLSDDEMFKLYGKDISLNEIKKERSYAQTALACGVPTLIPYDVVRCEQGYGIVFEKAEMSSLAYLIRQNPDKLGEYATMLGNLLKELHSTQIPADKLPDIKDRYREWLSVIDAPKDSSVQVYLNLISNIQDSQTYVHGDINLNSVMVQGDELLLLDMSGSARGHGIFDLQALFASLVALERKNPGYCKDTFGLPSNVCVKFWNVFFAVYMEHKEQEINSMNELLAKTFILKEKVLLKLEQMNRIA